jgi:hypothetical protein
MSNWLADLAERVHAALRGHKAVPPMPALQRLFEVMYFASLRTEEAHSITFHIVYIDPSDPDPSPPQRIVQDRWSYVPIVPRLPFDIAAVTKLAKASDPRSSSLAVYHDSEGELFVWGLIDQGNSYYDFVTYAAESGPERPGLFQASIAGVGHLAIYRRYELIADFRHFELRTPPIDALTQGPIFEVLQSGIQLYIEKIYEQVGFQSSSQRSHWSSALADAWLTALRRLLLHIQLYKHGGAVLIAPESAAKDLNVKYQLEYTRLRACLERRGVFVIRKVQASDALFRIAFEDGAQHLPTDLYFEESSADNALEESRGELDGILWFVSLLSRVDGLLLLSPDLDVRGFGVEIQTSAPPTKVVRAHEPRALRSKVTTLDYNYFGTRHRSMMRYCASVPGSVGFVVSQDGDVRAMTRVRDDLVVWENVKLRLDDFERRRPPKKSPRRP